ncbi:putative receptor-like protein kinase [Zea mays]|nr:putative protein kinase superfamily protein [Zea mays]XP_008676844.1 putative protein kinase superfamily protein isoform X1 [Zea mays]XP_008676845.1 putative protein kinase superfamily protein isoform X1 [Zea mays]XP_035822666.1 putative protein kinase superfamily protein isoform X1 [Zea mays]ACF86850.2 unknown [Zea mays]AQK58671.1 Receptor-like serine/threonine-protein kinase SD1-6 [Zea mays]AQK58673.1 Receptor-like serine/threonine-protein kinase SD1-6 [Zea mays]AQK58674.1 Receptor-like|eukprot:NP_001141681.2 putative protein kinase superfamily protein [Zea mays]
MMGNKTGKPVFSELKSTEFSLLESTLVQDHCAIPTCVPLDFLKAITSDFSKEQELGRGGFGVVYKGLLKNGKAIAVKKLSEMNLDDDQFHNEVTYLFGLKHKNIVQLKAYCAESRWEAIELRRKYVMAESRKRLLCFECINNKSLDKHLSAESHGVEWHIRYEIIKGICHGLHYLHTDCQIVHLDLKPENILLDDNMEPKITDFGMSRLFGLQQSKIITKTCGGTLGYMAPEYLLKGLISVKADIFSLGVIIIEVMTGGRNYPTCEKSCEQFAVDVVGRWRKRLLEEAGRYTPLEKYVEQVETCILIGLMCVDDDPNKRPTTLDIIERLTKVDVTNTDRGPPKTLEAATGLTGHPNLATRSFLDRFRRTIVIGMLKKALKIQDVSQLEQLLAKEVLLELHKIGTNATGNRSFLERLHASITMATLVQALHSLDLDPSAALRMEVLFLALENMRGKNNSRRRSEDVLELEERPEQIRSVLEAGTRARLSDEEHMPSVSVQAEDQAFPKPKLAKVRATAPVCVSAVWLAAGIGFLCGFTLGEMRGLRRTRVHERT